MVRPRVDDIIGEFFNELKVLCRDETNTRKFVCLCSCGKLTSTTKQRLKNGRTKSCGCKKSEYVAKASRKHGANTKGVKSLAYQSYMAMVHRCTNENRKGFEKYGGKGINIQDSWLEESPKGYLNFLKDMGERPENTSLDRIDGEFGYTKENCRWANSRLQAYNTKRKKTDKNTSKYRGVSKNKNSGMFFSRIGNGKGGYEWLGQYKDEVSAAEAYNKRAIELFGDSAMLNDI